jgi:hypothetical protein
MMTFDEVLGQVLELLRGEKRGSYRGLQRRFSLDESYLADLKDRRRRQEKYRKTTDLERYWLRLSYLMARIISDPIRD